MSDTETTASNTPFHDKLDPLVIDGSTSSHSYLAYARIGDAILAIKFGSPMDGKVFGVKGCTYIGGRVRSQRITHKIKEHLEEDAEASNVATFAKKTEDWTLPWPDVKFEKSDATRASTQTGAFIRGNLKIDAEALLDQFENGTVANKFADFLVATAGGHDNLLMSRDDLVGFVQEVYGPPAKAMRASLQAEKEVMEKSSSSENIGVFGFQSALMKELYEEKMTNHAPVPDEEKAYKEASPKEQAIMNGEEQAEGQGLSPGAQAGLDSEPEDEPHDDE